MEGCLAVPPKHPWTTGRDFYVIKIYHIFLFNSVSRHEILSIIRLILNTLTVAMRFEPGNARLFENEVCISMKPLFLCVRHESIFRDLI
jgi:hypothetical protein